MSSATLQRRAALAALRAKREGGTGSGVKREAGSDSDDDIYDEVTEEEYKSIVRGRMMDDDFIEDDDGSGYVDDGRDEWHHQDSNNAGADDDSEDETEYYERTGRKKKKRKGAAAAKAKQAGGGAASAYTKPSLLKPGREAPLTSSRSNNMDSYRPKVALEKEDDFMKKLMGGLGGDDEGGAMDSPSPMQRSTRVPLVRKRKQESLAERTSFGLRRHSPVSPPSSDPLDPPSDGMQPDVHITGSDTPPWTRDMQSSDMSDSTVPGTTAKRLRAASKRIGSLDLEDREHADSNGGHGDEANSDSARRRARSQSRLDPALLEALNEDINMDDDDDCLGFSVRAPTATGSKPSGAPVNVMRLNASGVRNRPTDAHKAEDTPVKVKQEQDDEPLPAPAVAAKPAPPALEDTWRTIGAQLTNVADAASVDVDPKAAKTSTNTGTTTKVNPYEPDGRRLRFFWCDYLEQQGVIYLIGKVKDQTSGRYVSACLQVGGMERCVYLMPREGATEDDVYEEFDSLREKYGIKNFLGKWVLRKYAFELADVPAEGHYLKVKYGFDEPRLPLDLQGKTFSRVFGANTSAFELFVVKRHIMGPCWLDVEGADLRAGEGVTPLSWCKVELSVDDPKALKPFADSDANAPRDTPPLTVMSISLRTIVNHKENKQEIVAVAARTWKDFQLDDTNPPEKLQSSLLSIVRPLSQTFPPKFEREAASGPTKVLAVKYERILLNILLAQIQQQDPDVIIGHEFTGVTFDILLHRMRDLKVDQWSRVGRLRRKEKLPTLKQGFNLPIASGRLLCDLASDAAKGMITSTTYSLTEMCASHLKVVREDIDPDDTVSIFDSAAPTPDRLMSFVRHNEVDAYFQMALACKVQILSLTKQLTNLAGNAWSRVLNGGRAERNEYILLHEFHRQKYICPDKLSKGERELMARHELMLQHKDDNDEDEAGGSKMVAKENKFKGGLVFDPKKGLWDKFVLVMDFNSLYPSLIQEYNIDFTTVDRRECNANSEDVDKMPDIPSSDVGQGVLPRLIATLVQRRRQVKSLMKDRNAPAAKQLQWDIKQLALKLTANSMYGCLGFKGSRFYARPLAALTTFKGREVLTATKELAESQGLTVIYGDTDSVMINTNVLDLAEAKRIGAEFKRAVNERYRLLEIETDAIFERMLLLQKKKYAAIKVEDDGTRATEVKGLDMKRREYCALSKTVSKSVLEKVLSGKATETVVEQIHEYLTEVGQKMDEVPLDDFIIYKGLSKNVNEYNEQTAKSLAHVQVAKRMQAKGISVRRGDVIPHVFCLLIEDDEGATAQAKTAQADRAYHPDDVRRKDSMLRIDKQYYLSQQVLPPVERLCDSIEGTDRSRLAEHLGLDASKYRSITLNSSGVDDRDFTALDSQTPDEIRFAECEPFLIDCPQCKASVPFAGLPGLANAYRKAGAANDVDSKEALKAERLLSPSGLTCPECDRSWGVPYVAMQLEASIRRHIALYYQAWTMCTEPSCGTLSRMQGIAPRRCLVNSCRGKVIVRYGDKALYNQLCYLESLFDGERALTRARTALTAATSVTDPFQTPAAKAAAHLVDVLQSRWMTGSPTRSALQSMHTIVDRYTARSGRRFIALDSLFGWMTVKP